MTIFAVYNKIKSNKRMEIYHDYGHEGLFGFDDIVLVDLDRIINQKSG